MSGLDRPVSMPLAKRGCIALFTLSLLGCGPAPHPQPPSGPSAGPAPTSTAPPEPSAPRPAFTVHVVDVGTGLGIFVQGEDFGFVYDAGSNDDTALGDDNRFVAYLKAVVPELQAIGHVVLSHPHRDHVELLPDVISRYRVANVWDSGAINPICGYRRFLEAIARSTGVVYHSAANEAGQHTLDFEKTACHKPELSREVTLQHGSKVKENVAIAVGKGATMTFLHVDGSRRKDDFNESSLVAVLDLDGTRMLLMGDAEAGGRDRPSKAPAPGSVEGYLLANHRAQLDADVLIAGHHGSISSSRLAFLAAVTPKISVISAGPTRYQSVTLPDPEVVAALEQAGKLFRTDIDDAACGAREQKVGPDADHNPGGCDNVQIQIKGGVMLAKYARVAD